MLDLKLSLEEMLSAYLQTAGAGWYKLMLVFVISASAAFCWKAVCNRISLTAVSEKKIYTANLMILILIITAGLFAAVVHASVYDDAYISFRYAKNLVEGKGLVFNEGERVEGYTNFLWTLLIAVLTGITFLKPPEIGLYGALFCFVLNLFVIYRISLKLTDQRLSALVFPGAVLLLALQDNFFTYGTTGMETMFAGLLVNTGVFYLIQMERAEEAVLSGFFLILAVLNRPDHALFYAAGSMTVFLQYAKPVWKARRQGITWMWNAGIRQMAGYALPFGLYLIYVAWKYHYYGQFWPNTYFAKSADLPYYSQGLIYLAQFLLSTHYWIVYILFTVFLFIPFSEEKIFRFKLFSAISVFLYTFYIVRVGGDFMQGRFFITLMPLLILGASMVVLPLQGKRSFAVLLIGLLGVTLVHFQMIEPRHMRWYITDEKSFYPVKRWYPVEVDHYNFRVGKILGKLHEKGVKPVVATSGVGMIGYNSNLKIVDRVGLTDSYVAKLPLKVRGCPGHEKFAPASYLHEKGVHFARGSGFDPRYQEITKMSFGPKGGGRRWHIYKYDREMMTRIKEIAPEIVFIDFENYLDDYISAIRYNSPKKIQNDLKWFKRYYFDHNDDHQRYNLIHGYLNRNRAF